MICGQCGDPLVKVPLIRPTQIFALIAAAAFIAPLLAMAIAFFKDLNQPGSQRISPPIAVIAELVKKG